ncbi:hypothetical protein [Oleidesulfovibrio sp.]|uniref:hypothetical protein n=1 Tax=Oleidesulfovibrio sp. TaxID=2909707 RepID=UPI003A8A59B6
MKETQLRFLNMTREYYHAEFMKAEDVRAQRQEAMFAENFSLAMEAFPEGSQARCVKGGANSIVEVKYLVGSWWTDMRARVRNPKTGKEYMVALHYLRLPEDGEE